MVDMDAVTEILRDAAREAILPRARALADGDVVEKSPGDLVTVADREAEELISARLRVLLDVPVVGEEAVHADPGLLRALSTEPTVWVVDPVDGTRNFVHGSDQYAVMVALVHGGRAVAAWILHPPTDRVYTAELGSGTWRDGERIHREPAGADPARLRGSVRLHAMEPPERQAIAESSPLFASVWPGTRCAGMDYALLLEGEEDFALFQHTLPWDHAPGALLLAEAGGVSLRLDGSPYRPGDDTVGLLNSAGEACWKTVRSLLLD
ncbi:inositol monophosphatase family protein [Nocardiopsis algeriensis]|uniref:Fructose-1,6-bisphosphatase/inositol monophosphatase family enzyme n=1 Tax=Nocardiopsis algeriensis TaxID=1478215 RepID=A0A841INI7_9ACTN|nr:inositol monophosphatase family protein [Nocardiopsis algeriensis]MBB6119740.1 fructose-1,6-bisphosphatase/inositol monophosphatase family enzyme [Nocardiopsis algeriensis]